MKSLTRTESGRSGLEQIHRETSDITELVFSSGDQSCTELPDVSPVVALVALVEGWRVTGIFQESLQTSREAPQKRP